MQGGWEKCFGYMLYATHSLCTGFYIYLYSVEKEEENLSLSLFLRISFLRKDMILVM